MRLSRLFTGVSCALVIAFALPQSAPAQIILSDIVAAGDGTGNAPAEVIGIDPRDGNFAGVGIAGHIFETDPEGDGENPSPVADSPFVDSVFFIGEAVFDDADVRVVPVVGGDPVVQGITQSGVTFEFPSQDAFGSSWNNILSNQNGGGGVPYTVGGAQVAHGIGIHAAAGITFNLDEIRAAHGDSSVECFQTIWGTDGCGSVDVNLYVILSDDEEVLESHTTPALVNHGELLQIDLDSSMKYLTLATGSNGADGCDHGNFGLARLIEGSCPAEIPLVALSASPDALALAPGGSQQLTVVGTDDLGFSSDLTSSFSGTTYASGDDGVASVDAEGLVSASGNGETTITVANGDLEATVAVTVGVPDYLDLGDIAVGGDGFGTADPLNIGINADLGTYVQARLNANVPESNFINPMPVDGSDGSADNPMVNSVFVIEGAIGQAINTEQVAYDFEAGDEDIGWEAILNGREAGGPDYLDFGAAPDGSRIVFTEGLGIHASQGITFDLQAIRDEHGAERVAYVSAVAGENDDAQNNAGLVNTYMILSDEEGIIADQKFLNAANTGQFQQMEIPPEALFLTLAVGDANNGIGSDHGAFGRARITAEPVETEIEGVDVQPASLLLNVAETVTLSISAVLGGDLAGLSQALAPEDVSFSSDDPGIAEVDDLGNVIGESVGLTTVRVTVGGTEVAVPVQVGKILVLSDMVGQGDGTGTADPQWLGIDPRNGAFVDFEVNGHIYETDPEGDGVNPSPVVDSDFIDSVFIIGEAQFDEGGGRINPVAGGKPVPVGITQSGVEFEFPSEDAFGSSWNMILKDDDSGAVNGSMLVGGQQWDNGIGVHAACGMTFDLEAIRDTHGADAAGTISLFWGMDACGGNVNHYLIFSNDDEVITSLSFNALANQGEHIETPIPVAATYVTFAVGSNGADGCDHGNFADAKLLSGEGLSCPDEGDTHCNGVSVDIGEPNFLSRYPVDIIADATDDSGDAISYEFVLTLSDGSTLTGTSDTGVFSTTLAEGSYSVEVTADDDAVCTDAADDASCTLEFDVPADIDTGPIFRRGDADQNGMLQLTDAINILGFLFLGNAEPECLDAADIDDNSLVQLTDAIFGLNFLFTGGAEPVAPGPHECGEDGTPDDGLGCESYSACD